MNTLTNYKKNIVSQWGEDGIIEEIFNRIGATNKTCIEFGAWDAKYYSNTWNLWFNNDWSAILIEGDGERYNDLVNNTKTHPKVTPHLAFVAPEGEHSLDSIVPKIWNDTPVDLLSIDIDGDDYYIFEKLQILKPRVLIIEHNPTVPAEYDIVQSKGANFGSSARAIYRLSQEKGYKLICHTDTNSFFIRADEFAKLQITELTLEESFMKDHLTYVMTSYNGLHFLTREPSYTVLGREIKTPVQYLTRTEQTDPTLQGLPTIIPVAIKKSTWFAYTSLREKIKKLLR